MATPLTKSSAYTQSLIDFVIDTKPYRCKLTEVTEEYQFSDSIHVNIEEVSSIKTLHKAAWTFGFFSSGNPSQSSILAQRVVTPDFNGLEINSDPSNNPGRWKAGRDENTDMAAVPLVFSKKQIDGSGIADAWLEIDGTSVLPYVEGHDFYQGRGSFEFQVKQTYDAFSVLKPRWAETRNDGVIASATTTTHSLEQDLSRPQSAVNKLITLVSSIQAHLNLNPSVAPGWTLALTSCGTLLSSLTSGIIPPAYTVSPGNPNLLLAGDYSNIVEGAAAAGVIPLAGFAGWIGEDSGANKYVDEAFSALLPPLLFGMHTDIGLYEDGAPHYDDVVGPSISVTSIVPNTSAPIEEWTLTAISSVPSTWSVTGSHSDFIGTVVAGTTFTSTHVSFSTTDNAAPAIGDVLVLTPRDQLVIHPSAPLETWNIIKTNPRTYTRPVFVSSGYGQVLDLSSVPGSVSLLDITMPAGTYILRAVDAVTFDVSSTADPLYTGTATVGVTYNDGTLGFTLVQGTLRPFEAGDYFLIEVVNGPASPLNFDLYYGYDLESYDNSDLVYNNTNSLHSDYNRFLDFRFDSRFTDYDVTTMGLVVTQNAVNGRGFRLTAVPDVSRPIATLKRDGTTTSNAVDLTAEDDEIAPVSVTGVPVFSMPGDPNPAEDVRLYYATDFKLEYSDDGFVTVTNVGTVSVGSSFSSSALGISFNLLPGSKPFIAASCDDGLLNPRVEGGDVFFFSVNNPPPTLVNAPIGLVGADVPRLIMHGSSYFASVSANWVVTVTGASSYSVNGTYNSGPLTGTQVPGYPVVGTLSLATSNTVANTTFRDANIHFTIVAGRGLSPGDAFTFETHEPRPSFLVHGSVSGWQPDAEYDRWYFNGKIGFKIKSPTLSAFGPTFFRMPEVLGYHSFPTGYVKVNYLRPDTPANRYLFQRSADGFLVRRTDIDVQGHCPLNGVYEDEYISIEIADPTNDFQLNINPSLFQFWNAPDTVIVRSSVTALNPSASDYVVIKKTEDGSLAICVDYSNLLSPPDLSVLSPVSVNTAMTDFSTGFGGVALSLTSPETGPGFITGWLPTYIKKLDTTVSVAEFPDVAALLEVRSAQTGQLVGTLKPQINPFEEPTVFQFDATFFSTYLPLNSQVNLITYGTGLDENLHVTIAEHLNILETGSAIFENALFNESISVGIIDLDQKFITTTSGESFSTTVQDDFGGFLPGFGNMLFDNENSNGYYSVGTPLTDYFIEAQQLAGIIPLTSYQTAQSAAIRANRLDVLQQMLGNYLIGGSVLLTTLSQFLAAVDADPAINYTPVADFGLPAQGMASSVDEASTDGGTASIQEGFSVQFVDPASGFDELSFDASGMDEYGGRTALLYPQTLPPVGTPGIDYSTTVTPLEVAGFPVSTFVLVFTNPPLAMSAPTIQLWAPGDTLPRSVGTVQTISNGRFQFNVPLPIEAKIVVT